MIINKILINLKSFNKLQISLNIIHVQIQLRRYPLFCLFKFHCGKNILQKELITSAHDKF